MEDTIDYSQYSFRELREAFKSIERESYPERADELAMRIAQHPDNPENASTKQQADNRYARVKFHGDGVEFFKIWIVNILLTVITLGIYSAWATVRTNRYFYSNTEIDSHRLSYLAEPIQILKGRIIAVIAFAVYYVVGIVSPIAQFAVLGLLAVLAPFIIRMSLRFKFRMTAYRNVSFDFKASIKSAYYLFMLLPLIAMAIVGSLQYAATQGIVPIWMSFLAMFGLFALYPLMLKMIDVFIYSNATFGNKSFSTNIKAREYYTAMIVTILLAVFLVIVLALVLSLTLGISFAAMGDPTSGGASFFITYLIMMISYIAVLFTVNSFYTAWIRNHLYCNTLIEDVCHFQSDLGTMDLVYLRLSNLFLIVFTLGLAIPWTKVRTARLFASATGVNLMPGAESVIDQRSQSSAVADEVADVFDFDIGIA